MLQPKSRKYRKEFRGKMRGLSTKGSTLAYGDFGMQATEPGWVTARQLEAARKVIVRHTKRKGKTWLKVFPHKPVTAKSSEVKRGSGKGEVDHYVAVIKPGRIIFELGGLPEEVAVKSLSLAAQKFPLKMKIINK